MGICVLINENDLMSCGPLKIRTYHHQDQNGQWWTQTAEMDGWVSPGRYYSGRVEFDFNTWGGTRKWLESWLIENGVPYTIA